MANAAFRNPDVATSPFCRHHARSGPIEGYLVVREKAYIGLIEALQLVCFVMRGHDAHAALIHPWMAVCAGVSDR